MLKNRRMLEGVGSWQSAVSSWPYRTLSKCLIRDKQQERQKLRIRHFQSVRYVIKFLFFILFPFLLTACFQPETGCLNIEAKNFSPAADENCGGDDIRGTCPCNYPILSFDTVDYFVGKLEYMPDSFYLVNNQTIQLKSIQFYLSGFQFIRADGEKIGVEDTISLTVLNEEEQVITSIFPDDFLLINQQSKIDIGAITQSGQFDSIRFVVGLEEQINTTDPTLVNNSQHPLAAADMHLGEQNLGYIFNRIILQTDTSAQNERTLNISGNTNLVEIKRAFSYKTPIGKDFSLGTLRIDHAKWFDGINFVTDNETLILEKIVTNTPRVFSVSP